MSLQSEFWFLDTAVKDWVALPILARHDHQFILNKAPHGLAEDGLLDVLLKLSASEEIAFRRTDLEVPVPDREAFRTEVRKAPDWKPGYRDRPTISYGLTLKGGARWETWAKADWQRYLGWRGGDDWWELTCASRSFLETYMKHARRFISPELAYDGSEQWDAVSKWPATYWKSLPLAHRVRFEIRYPESRKEFETPSWWRDWVRDVEKWYVDPYPR